MKEKRKIFEDAEKTLKHFKEQIMAKNANKKEEEKKLRMTEIESKRIETSISEKEELQASLSMDVKQLE